MTETKMKSIKSLRFGEMSQDGVILLFDGANPEPIGEINAARGGFNIYKDVTMNGLLSKELADRTQEASKAWQEKGKHA